MDKGLAYAISAVTVGFGVWIFVAGLGSSSPVLWTVVALIPISIGVIRFRPLMTAARRQVDLTEIERAFLKQLTSEPWISTPLFDHEIVARLVELGLVEAALASAKLSTASLPPPALLCLRACPGNPRHWVSVPVLFEPLRRARSRGSFKSRDLPA